MKITTIFAKINAPTSNLQEMGFSEASYTFYLGRNDGFVEKFQSLNVKIQFLLCGCLLYSLTVCDRSAH